VSLEFGFIDREGLKKAGTKMKNQIGDFKVPFLKWEDRKTEQ
jgi:hypothetical protein